MSTRRPRIRRAFTIIELLVVVSIIMLLVAILLPSMWRARESAKRAVCSSQQHQIGSALTAFAVSRDRTMPPGNVVWQPGLGIYAVWGTSPGWASPQEAYQEYGRYRQHGILVDKGYLSTGEPFYCPSWTFENIQYGVCGPGMTDNGWPLDNDPVAAGTTWVQTTYAYRSTFDYSGGGAGTARPAGLASDSGRKAILAEQFSDPNRGIDQHHGEGYNTLYLDGSVEFLHDPDNFVRDFNGGLTYHYGHAAYAMQEDVWERFFDRRGYYEK